MNIPFGWSIPAALLLAACQPPKAAAVLADMKRPAYERSLVAGAHRLTARYAPKTLRLLAHAELEGSRHVTKALLDSLEAESGAASGLQFTLRLDPRDSTRREGFRNDVVYGGLSGHAGYAETFNAYAFGWKESIWLESGGEKFPLLDYRMENDFGMTQGRTFVLLFPPLPAELRGRKAEVTLVLDDLVPGLAREKMTWTLPVGKYDEST